MPAHSERQMYPPPTQDSSCCFILSRDREFILPVQARNACFLFSGDI